VTMSTLGPQLGIVCSRRVYRSSRYTEQLSSLLDSSVKTRANPDTEAVLRRTCSTGLYSIIDDRFRGTRLSLRLLD
jgi:hypothetical protein